MKRSGWLWVIATLIFFQSSDVSLRLASVHTQFAVGTVLQALPLLLVSIIAAIRHRIKYREQISGQSVVIAASYGILQFFIGNLLFYAAVQHGGLSIASPAVQSQAIWAVLLGGLLLREKVSRLMIRGICCFVVGLVVLSWFKSAGAPISGGWIWAFVFGIMGGLAWASGSAVQSTLLRRGVPLTYLLAIGSLTGVVLLNLLILLHYGTSVWTGTGLGGASKVLAAGCFNGLAIWSISQALKTIEISKVIPVISLSIVFNTIIGGVWFEEYINAGSIVGMLIAFLGVVIVQEPKLRRPKRKGVQAI